VPVHFWGYCIWGSAGAVEPLPLRSEYAKSDGVAMITHVAIRQVATFVAAVAITICPSLAYCDQSNAKDVAAEVFAANGLVVFDASEPALVRSVDLSGCVVTSVLLHHLQSLATVETLDLSNTAVNDAVMEEVARISTLRSLNLSGTSIGGRGIRELSTLKRLRRIWLPSRISDADVVNLLDLEGLEDVRLSGHSISDASIVTLSKLRRLSAIDLDGTRITGQGLRSLSVDGRIRSLAVAGEGDSVNDQMIAVAPLEGLENVAVGGLVDRGLLALSASKSLKTLRVVSCGRGGISGSGLQAMAALPGLECLDLRGVPALSDDDISPIARFSGLRELRLNGRVTNTGVSRLGRLRELRILDLGLTDVSDAALDTVGSLRSLEDVDLWFTNVTDDGLLKLAPLDALLRLNIADTKVTDAGMPALAGHARLRRLIAPTRITDLGLQSITRIASLEELGLSGTKITDSGIAQLRQLAGIRVLDLSYTQISGESIGTLSRLKGLRILFIRKSPLEGRGAAALSRLLPGVAVVTDRDWSQMESEFTFWGEAER
jgi:Leucine-rich repeat (LRR) protein